MGKTNKGKKILIVEDEPMLREILESAIAKAGFEVIEAGNGKHGLLLAIEKHPDLIILDLRMPDMDGLTMLQKLRADTWGQHVPVIIYTNADTPQEIKDAGRYGVYDYIVKVKTNTGEIIKLIEDRLKG